MPCVSITFRRFVHAATLYYLHYPSLHYTFSHFSHHSTTQQQQFPLCIAQATAQALAVMAASFALHIAHTLQGLLMPSQAPHSRCSIPFSLCPCLCPKHSIVGLLSFSLRNIPPISPLSSSIIFFSFSLRSILFCFYFR